MSPEQIRNVVETALLVAGRPMAVDALLELFGEGADMPDRAAIREALAALEAHWQGRGVELKQVAGGYRFQARAELSAWIGRLWAERPSRYSRALLETLALIAYRQPITRGEIEDIRGVSVSSSIVKTLLEREWVRVLGHREVPGRPAMYGTTREFLDHFNLKSLDELPPLAEIRDLDSAPDLFAAAEAEVQVAVDAGEDRAGTPGEGGDAPDAGSDATPADAQEAASPEATAATDESTEAPPEDAQEPAPAEGGPIEDPRARD